MTRAGSSRPVRKRGRGKSVAERMAALLGAKPPREGGLQISGVIVDELVNLPGCAKCGLLICDCTDSHWQGGGDAR